MAYNRNQRRDGGRDRYGSSGGGSRGGENDRYSGKYGRDYRDNGLGAGYGRSNMGGGGGGGNAVNPWAGNSGPDRSASLLPTPGATNILSQLTNSITSPEAQLAIASTLLSKLWTPAANTQNNVVPSLLNLNSLGSNYSNNNYSGRENDRGRNYQSRRVEPYNKSSMNRRNQAGKARSTPSQNRRSKPSSSPAKTTKKSDSDSKENTEKKGKIDAKKENIERKEFLDEDRKFKVSDFLGIPKALLYCYVCHKHMWDDISFEKHIKGRPHEWMLTKLDESNKLVVDLLRHQVRTNEEQRLMKMKRTAKKKNRNGSGMKCEFCAMCDVDIRGSLAAHRRNYLHLKLKKFLHPKCLACKKEFHNRLDFNLHKISADHLKILAEKRRSMRPELSDEDFDLEDFIVIDDVDNNTAWAGDESSLTGEFKVTAEIDAVDDIGDSANKEDGDVEMKDDEKEKENRKMKEEKDEDGKIPNYNPAASIGMELLVEVKGKMCRACGRFMKNEEDASIHCRTLTHFENYRNLCKAQYKVLEERKGNSGKDKENGDIKKEPDDDDEDVLENGNDEDEEEDEEEEEENNDHNSEDIASEKRDRSVEDEKMEEESKPESKTKEEKESESEKYDPQEPTEEVPEKSPKKPVRSQRARKSRS